MGNLKKEGKKFSTRYEAQKETKKMLGWKIKIISVKRPDGNYFLIQCDGNLYLREDGFVN